MLAGGGLRAFGDPPLARLQRHQVHALKRVAHDAPALAGGVLHDANEKQRQPAQLHVRTDAVLTEVEHRAQTQRPLQVAPAALDLVELLVGECQIGGGESLIGGAQEPLTVETLVTGDGGAVEAQPALLGAPEQAVECGPRAQRPDEFITAYTRPGVGARDLALEVGDEVAAHLAITRRRLRVVADDEALCAGAGPQAHLFDLEVTGYALVATGARERG